MISIFHPSNIRGEVKPGIINNLPATDAQSLERDHRSARECLKRGIKEFQPDSKLASLGTQLKCVYTRYIPWGINKMI